MAQEFTIKSQQIEDKINQLLPSQGGFEPGVDFSASTMVIPIVDLTETAEGSSLRQDLQSAFSHNQATVFDVNNTTSTIVTTTGYFRIIGSITIVTGGSTQEGSIILNDGTTDKIVYSSEAVAVGGSSLAMGIQAFDFIVKLDAGDSLKILADANVNVKGSTRQIADVNGNLTNP